MCVLKSHTGSAGVSPAPERPKAAAVACGHDCGRDVRAPSRLRHSERCPVSRIPAFSGMTERQELQNCNAAHMTDRRELYSPHKFSDLVLSIMLLDNFLGFFEPDQGSVEFFSVTSRKKPASIVIVM